MARTPVTFVPPGYQPDLDRLPPATNQGCGRLVGFVLLGIIVLGAIVLGVYGYISNATASPIPPTRTSELALIIPPTEAPLTPDGWAMTGTAVYLATVTPTLDYCWFLTPSPTPSPTSVPLTPDAWGLTGTAVYLQTGTPTATPLPTLAPPRAWCDLQTPTLTPLPLGRLGTREAVTTTIPTSTLFPTLPPTAARPAAQAPVAQPDTGSGSSNPVVQQPPNIVVQTQPVIVVVTATPQPTGIPTATPTMPTATLTATASATATVTATQSPTMAPETPTATSSATATATATETATETPTTTPTATPTENPTLTPLPLPTITPSQQPTAIPLLAATAADCSAGYPVFVVANFGAQPGQLVNWIINLDGVGAVAVGSWYEGFIQGSFMTAAAPDWIGVGGVYTLIVDQSWMVGTPTLTAAVVCPYPTQIPSSTPTFTATPTAAPTATETETPTP